MRAYYINLANRPERRANMVARLAALGIESERVEALTPADVTDAQRARYCDPTAYRWQTEGELACSLSHLAAMKAFLDTQAQFAAIFEDDAILSPRLSEFLDAFEQQPPALDLLRLETDNSRLRLSPQPAHRLNGFGLYRLYVAGGGAAAYVISRRGAERALASDALLANLTDQALFNPNSALSKSLVVRQLVPALAVQEDRVVTPERQNRLVTSDLEPLRRDRGQSDGRNFWRRAAYNFYDLVERDIVGATRKAWNRAILGVVKTDIPFKAD